MASLRVRTRVDGTKAFQVLFRRGYAQESRTFEAVEGAEKFKSMCDRYGTDAAVRILEGRMNDATGSAASVADAMRAHIASLTGVGAATIATYETTLRVWVEPHVISELPVADVTRADAEGCGCSGFPKRRPLEPASVCRGNLLPTDIRIWRQCLMGQ